MGLNYIWDLLVRAGEAGIEKRQVKFLPAKVYSPYMELSLHELNAGAGQHGLEVEVNPHYRFPALFGELLDINLTEDPEFRSVLFDILMHFLAELDLMQGMNKREYYIRFVLRDMKSGAFGERVKERMSLFDRDEQEFIAGAILRMYDTGEPLHLLKSAVGRVFRRSTIYVNSEEKDEMLFYIGQKRTEQGRLKLETLMELFLPVRYRTEVYWDCHVGIIDAEETMIVDRIALY
ncbi:iron-dependent peroxidase [Paenibacillus oralis]|uniref:Iron-dependent peroxidase n=1 Tax=Paenibacillus oralis TaxID=2490856 RepID=A0A3P3TUT8_9BACL|nr:iron-dependent peroxidase [Paenibacillus oralis]RRJ61902.1 iron-dependent peroxidase [Paenibacillus oralis]